VILRTITGHAWLARNTGRDQDDLSTSQALLDAGSIGLVTLDLVGVSRRDPSILALLHTVLLVLMWETSAATPVRQWSINSSLGPVVESQSDRTWGTLDVVERKLGNARVELEEKRQRLANTASSTENGDLGVLSWSC